MTLAGDRVQTEEKLATNQAEQPYSARTENLDIDEQENLPGKAIEDAEKEEVDNKKD